MQVTPWALQPGPSRYSSSDSAWTPFGSLPQMETISVRISAWWSNLRDGLFDLGQRHVARRGDMSGLHAFSDEAIRVDP